MKFRKLRKLTIADEEGGLKMPKFGWDNMWTAPNPGDQFEWMFEPDTMERSSGCSSLITSSGSGSGLATTKIRIKEKSYSTWCLEPWFNFNTTMINFSTCQPAGSHRPVSKILLEYFLVSCKTDSKGIIWIQIQPLSKGRPSLPFRMFLHINERGGNPKPAVPN